MGKIKMSKTYEKSAAFKQLTDEIREILKSDPLPPEFDEILNNRVNFTRKIDFKEGI